MAEGENFKESPWVRIDCPVCKVKFDFRNDKEQLDRVLVQNVGWLRSNILLLLKAIGSEGVCKGCGQKIYWVKTKNGKNAPYTVDGLNHFADCRQAGLFKGQ